MFSWYGCASPMTDAPRPPAGGAQPFEKLRFFSGAPRDFWPAFIQSLTSHAGATVGLIVLKDSENPWRVLSSAGALDSIGLPAATISSLADSAYRDRFAFERIKETETGIIGLKLESGNSTQQCVAVLVIRGRQPNLQAVCGQLLLVADTPLLYQNHRRLQQADTELGQFTGALDLLLLLNGHTRFGAVAMTFCNELATRFRAIRVTLGWLEGRYVRLQAISHMEHFERKMEMVQRLEAAMEETLDQDEEIVWPAPHGSMTIVRDHEAFALTQRVSHLLSIPLRVDGKPVGVVLLERQDAPFSEADLRSLRMLCDQTARRIDDLKQTDRWFGARWLHRGRKALSKVVGAEHTGAKVAGLVAVILVLVLVFGKLPYRVEAPFLVRAAEVTQIPAPFDGFIDSVDIRVGDAAAPGQILLRLDERDLQVEEAESAADLRRYIAEAEQAESEQRLGDMRVAQQRAEQARASLELARFRISRAAIKAPSGGVIVGGDWRERIGSPVKRGELLFTITRLEELYPELKVNEADVHEVQSGATGEIAFAGRPDLKFPIIIERVEPAAVADDAGNIFLVRANFADGPQGWWRPGMTGLAKIDAGKRSILWILTHRAVDFLRMRLWW